MTDHVGMSRDKLFRRSGAAMTVHSPLSQNPDPSSAAPSLTAA